MAALVSRGHGLASIIFIQLETHSVVVAPLVTTIRDGFCGCTPLFISVTIGNHNIQTVGNQNTQMFSNS